MTWGEILILTVVIVLLLSFLIFIFCSWYRDYKAWKYQKNKPRILNPWSDW